MTLAKRSVLDLALYPGAAVLVRVDYNVPFDPGTQDISDDSRITGSVGTIRYLQSQGCKVILCSHLGRPGGQRNADLTLEPIARRLSEILDEEIAFVGDCVGCEPASLIQQMSDGEVALLENLRFHTGEEANAADFIEQLASLAEFYVNDGFGAGHRKHASTHGVACRLPAAAGLLMEREITALNKLTENPDPPYAVVVGGAKVMDKLPLIQNLSDKADLFLIGGGMAASFLAAASQGADHLGVDDDERSLAEGILRDAPRKGYEVVIPVDVVVADRFAEDADSLTCRPEDIPPGHLILDTGPRTVELYAARLAEARTIVWNGPMGVFEWSPFAQGTVGIAKAIAARQNAYTVIGGGSTSDAVTSLDLVDRYSHVSTGGGATLEFLEGKELPGIAALDGSPETDNIGESTHMLARRPSQ